MAVFYIVETFFEMNMSHVNTYSKRKHSKYPPPPSQPGFGRLPDGTVKHRNLGCPQPNKHLRPKRSFWVFFIHRPFDPFC